MMRKQTIGARLKARIGWVGPTRSGQTLVFFALTSVVLVGMMGLVLDAGYDFGQRRTMQNVADAAALQGARNVLKNSMTTISDVTAIAINNGLRDPLVPANRTTLTCSFVDNTDANVGPCGSVVPLTATGVQVRVTEQHDTFVLRVLGISTSQTGVIATAHVEALAPDAFTAGDGPFIVCGYNTTLTSGSSLSILQTDGSGKALNPPRFNPAANGQTFEIHGSQVAGCDTQGNRFKGDNYQDANAGLTIPSSGIAITYDPGGRAGPMRQRVTGVNGCDLVQTQGCVMILPIADNVSVDGGKNKKIHAVGYAAFLVTQTGDNSHSGKLLEQYGIQARGTLTWTSTQPSLITVIRLTQ